MNQTKKLTVPWRLRTFTILAVSAALLGSCSKETRVINENGNQELRFEIAQPEWNTTKGIQVTEEKFHKDFAVYAAAFPSSQGWSEDLPLNFMWNVKVSQINGSIYQTVDKYFLPGAGKSLRFFAIAPYGAAEVITTGSGVASGTPEIRFSVNETITDHTDLCIAQSSDIAGDGDGTVNLDFYHALVSVKFITGTVPASGKIRRISLKNIHTGAVHNPATTGAAASWDEFGEWKDPSGTTYGGIKDISLNTDVSIDGTAQAPLTTEEQTFMIIPGCTLENSVIEILYDPDGKESSSDERILSAKPGDELGAGGMGTTVTYRISIVNESLILSSTIQPWETEGPETEGGAY